MFYLLLSILFNTILYIIFKVFKKYDINVLQALIVNYFVAFLLAFYYSDTSYSLLKIPNQKWYFATLILGFLFIALFDLIAKTTQYLGVSVAAISGKMSMVIPVLFGILVYNEPTNILKVSAIILALIAVYLTSLTEEKELNLKLIYYPIILFFGSGILDTLLKYFEKKFVADNEVSIFIGTIFFNAMIIGIVFLFFTKKKETKLINFKNVLGGIILGVFNYYAMFFLVKSLQTLGKSDSSKVFTLNNIGIVLLSAIFGYILFKEKFSKKNILGIILALISVYLLM
jgi:drug/metabolite transporter (DMT)-like permease